jgi:16S rRNA (adenine1518-N6/adenine1519-N6)-dimethyltransferase
MSDLKPLIEAQPPLREVIEAAGLRATKALGQNFLLDQNITDKIIRHAHDLSGKQTGDLSGYLVFEIGPGPGGLTRSILKANPAKLIAIEFDQRAIDALQPLKQAVGDRLELVHGDATKIDLKALNPTGLPVKIIANLPYNVATPLLVGWLHDIYEHSAYDEMLLMFQKEVAQRICAKCGDNHYGRLGVLSQWIARCKIAFDLPPQAFTPPPKVKSAIVGFRPKEFEKADFKSFEKLTAAAFGQRRKMIRQSLKQYLSCVENVGLEPTLRAENLSVDDFIKLALAFKPS